MSTREACDDCLARGWLLGRLAPNLELVRNRILPLLALEPDRLIDAVGGKEQSALRRELAHFDASHARRLSEQAGVAAICRCQPQYPDRLRALDAPPSVLHVVGATARLEETLNTDPVAIVGARRASPYGLEIAGALAHGLGAAGVGVISGMALGIDSAAHRGALDAGGATIAVLPAGAERPYPASKRALHARILHAGAAISELAPGTGVWRWTFPARNRIIAALAAMTIVVEAGAHSGALLTGRTARELDRPVGAVPGRVTSPQAAGPNALLADGAFVIRGAQDVLDVLYGPGVRQATGELRAELAPALARLLAAIADGHDTPAALERAGVGAEQGLAALAELELAGYLRREAGGRFSVRA